MLTADGKMRSCRRRDGVPKLSVHCVEMLTADGKMRSCRRRDGVPKLSVHGVQMLLQMGRDAEVTALAAEDVNVVGAEFLQRQSARRVAQLQFVVLLLNPLSALLLLPGHSAANTRLQSGTRRAASNIYTKSARVIVTDT